MSGTGWLRLRRTVPALAGAGLLLWLLLPAAAATRSGAGGNPGSQPARSVPRNTAPATQPDRPTPWLGLMVGRISDPVRAHLAVPEGIGLEVLNIAEEGPAEKAGLRRYDVILAIDGKGLLARTADFAAALRRRSPGQVMKLAVASGGKVREVSLTVEAQPTDRLVKYRHPPPADLATGEPALERNKVYLRTPEGWKQIDVTSRTFHQLPPEVQKRLLASVQPNYGRGPSLKVSRDFGEGRSIEVEQDLAGRITVRHRRLAADASQEVVVRTYASPADLRAADVKAYQILEEIVAFRQSGFAAPGHEDPAGQRPEADPGQTITIATVDPGSHPANGSATQPAAGGPPPRPVLTYEFKVLANGSIEVWLRAGDLVIPRTFQSEAEFRQDTPTLYRRYEQLRKGVDQP